MIEFLPILADKETKTFINADLLPFVIENMLLYKHRLFDDYYPLGAAELINAILNDIKQLYPWFLVSKIDNEPAGAVWVSHWHGNSANYHSCQVHAFFIKKYWGKPAFNAAQAFLSILFNNYNLKRVQVEIPEFNNFALSFAERLGFVREGLIRNASLKNNKPVNHYLYSVLNNEFINFNPDNVL